MHREDVKALLRKRYGTLEKFAVIAGVEAQAVRDLLRGKSQRAHPEVAAEVGVEPGQLVITHDVPVRGLHTNTHTAAHRLNAGEK